MSESDLQKAFNEALDLLEAMLWQHYGIDKKTPDGKPMYDHLCMSDGEDASEFLENHGRLTFDQSYRF